MRCHIDVDGLVFTNISTQCYVFKGLGVQEEYFYNLSTLEDEGMRCLWKIKKH